MKYTFWIITLFFSFAVAAQEPLTDELTDSKSAIDHKAKHSFIFSGGMFVQNTAQKSNNDYYGWSASGAYQIYFPSRFVLGFEYLIDRSTLKKGIAIGSSNAKYKNKIKAYSIGVHLGFQFLRTEHFDFSLLLIPHYNFQKNLRKTYFNDEDGYVNTEYNEAWVFTPILFHRLEFYYKLDRMNGFGLSLDGNIDIEWREFWGSKTLLLGRLMLSYRLTIPN